MVEITARTDRGQLLLKPCPELNARILEILGRALCLYPLALHAFVFLSNHWHALVTVQDAEQLSRFLQYVNGNVAKAAKQVHGWDGAVWGHRPNVIAVVDDDSAEGRYRYILAHGAKEGLVRSPLDWPGVSSARSLALGEALEGIRHRRRRAAASPFDAPQSEHYPIHLAPLPAWSQLSTSERQRRTLTMTREIERDAADTHAAVIGPRGVVRQSPFDRYQLTARPAPVVHAAESAARERFFLARAVFYDAYRAAASDAASMLTAVADRFPPGAFPPRPPLSVFRG